MSDPAIYSHEAGCFISSKFERLAEIIKDYDQYLELRWIPPSNRTSIDSFPYAIVHLLPDRQPYTVFYFAETEDPARILARLFYGDSSRVDTLTKIEKEEAARKIIEEKTKLDELMEQHDKMHFLMTNRSNNYVTWKDEKTGELVKLDSDRRRV